MEIANDIKFNKKTRRFILYESVLILLVIFILLILTLYIPSISLSYRWIVLTSIISTIICFTVVFVSNKIKSFGITFVLLLYYSLTHLSVPMIYYFLPHIVHEQYAPHQYAWLESSEIILAITLSVVGQVVFLMSSLLFSNMKNNNKVNKTKKSIWIPKLGLVLLFINLFYFLLNTLKGNFSLNSGYNEFNVWRSDSTFFPYAIFLLATGFIFVISTGTKSQIKKGFIIYLFISVILLLTGNKGEVLYAVLAGVGIYYSRGYKLSKKILILGLITFFIIIPFVTNFRHESLLDSINELSISLFAPFLEIGWQLRTVVEVLSWIRGGEPIGLGISYFAAVQRILSSMTLNILPRIPITNVPWSFGERLPGWGFSQVAESVYNFGKAGPLIFYTFLGWFTSTAENEQNNDYKIAINAGIVVILMILTRNRFSFVPGQILMTIGLVIIAKVLDDTSINSKHKDYRRLK